MKLSILGVFFCLVVVACGENCPSEEEVYPCSCEDEGKDVILRCSAIVPNTGELKISYVQRALKSLKEAKNIHLILYDIMNLELEGDVLAGYQIKTLKIKHCLLMREEFSLLFTGLENTLEKLTIEGSYDVDIPLIRLNHLTSLRELDISYNSFHELNEKSFPSSLKVLSLLNTEIKIYGDHVFANLVNLETLLLDGALIGFVKRSWLPSPAEKLRLLNLDDNDLACIPHDLFDKMPALREVSLKTNHIRRMDEDAWENILSQLRRINLQENPLLCDSHMDWMLQRELSASLIGTCVGPKDREGKTLQELVQNH